jgi:hypothetical protein
LEFATEIKLRYPAAKGHDAQVFYLDIQRMCCPEPHFFFFCSLEAYPSIELGLQFPQEHQLYKLCNVYLIITLYGYRGRIMCMAKLSFCRGNLLVVNDSLGSHIAETYNIGFLKTGY